MPNITIVNGSFCHLNTVVGKILERGAWHPVHTRDVIEDAARRSGLPESRLSSVFFSKTALLDRFTHDKDQAAAWLRLALAHLLLKKDMVIAGPAALLAPDTISHVLRICLISDLDSRIRVAADQEQMSEPEARKRISQYDGDLSQWCQRITGGPDPWNPQLYDMLLPMDQLAPEEAARQIADRTGSEMLTETPESRQKAEDLRLTAEIGVALAEKGRHVEIHVERGRVTLTVNEKVLFFSHLAEELTRTAEAVPEVLSVTVARGKEFHKPDIYRRQDFELPTKVLLVDDERKFVQTLSNRLVMRDLGASVAYDGQSALEMIEKERPQVMVLDLKMPGMDGIEVLKIVREKHPDISVVILTGQGSEMDRQICLGLGAVAYLQKPVTIDKLSQVLEEAARTARDKISGK